MSARHAAPQLRHGRVWARLLLASLVFGLMATQAQAALTVTSIDIPARIGRGQTAVVPVSYTRASGSDPETVVANVPALLEIVAPLPAGCTLAGAAGSAQTLTCTGVDPGAIGSSGSFSFNVLGRSLGGGNVSASNTGPPASSATDSFSVVSGGDLTVAKSIAPGSTLINGQTATFTLTPALSGDTLPPGGTVTVTDQLPGTAAEFSLTGVNAPGYACNSVFDANASRSLVCTASGPLASLGPISVAGRPTLNGAGGLVNTASIAADGVNYIDIVSTNNLAQQSFSVEPGSDPRPGGSFPATAVTSSAQTLTVNYINGGPQTITGGTLRVAIPTGFTLGPLPTGCVNSGAGTVAGISGTVLTCTSGTVTSGGSQSFLLPLTVPGAAQAGNFGVEVVTGPDGSLPGGLTDANTGNNQTLVPYTIVPPYADLSLSKTKTPGPLPAGAAITNTIVVTNGGIAPAVYSAGGGATPLRVVDTMSNDEEFVSAGTGWSCTDGGANSGGAGLRRVVCVADAAATLAVGATLGLTLNTRVAPTLVGPVTLTNTACTGAQALATLGLTPADGPQPPDGNQNGGSDCESRTSVGTPVISGQAQASVRKESSRDGITWVDAVAGAPTVLATDSAMFWRITLTTPSTAVNAVQQPIPTLSLTDALPGVLNLASPGAGIPAHITPDAVVATTVLAGSAGGTCPLAVTAASPTLNCNFTGVAPGTSIQVTVRVDRPFEAGTLSNTASLSSPDAILTAAVGGQLADAAALQVLGRSDPAITSKTVSPPNSATEPRVGQVISYTMVARNLGANGVVGPMTVIDALDPARFVVLGAQAVGSRTSPVMNCSFVVATGTVTCSTGAGTVVPRYDFYSITVQVRVLKPAGVLPIAPGAVISSFTNVATVALDPAQNCEFRDGAGGSATCNDPASRSNNSGSALVDIKVPLVDLAQKKSRVLPAGQTNFGFGDALRYRFRAQNSGPSRAEGLLVTDRPLVPAGYTITLAGVVAVNAAAPESGLTLDTSKTLATLSCTQAGSNADVVCRLAPGAADFLDPATEVNFDLAFTLAGPTQVVSVGNTALICADETANYESAGACSFDTALAGNNSATVNDVVFPKTDLALSKTRITPNPVSINQPVEYSLVLRNLGADSTTQLRLADQLPPNFEWLTGGSFTPTAVPGGFAGLAVTAIDCTATPGAITVAGQQQTVNCVLQGSFPGSADASNNVSVRLFARPKAGFFTGPYLSDRANSAAVSPGVDAAIPPQPLSIDSNPGNNSGSANTQVQAASLAGTVFQDRDRSAGNAGTPQAAAQEPRLAGVNIRLTGTDAFGNAVDLSTTTDASGNYSFNNLAPASGAGYTLTQTQPAGFVNGPSAPPSAGPEAPTAAGTYAGGGAGGDSSYSGITLAAGVAAVNFNFPEVRQPTLAGFVYIDSNANGVRDAGTDPAIAGATVRLLNAANGSVVATTSTAVDGSYAFAGLDPLLVYTLEEPLPAAPAGLVNGPVNSGLINGLACASGCTAIPAGTAGGTDRISTIDLGAGVDGSNFNFGEVQVSVVSGTVYLDRDRSNTLDPGAVDGRLAGVTVRLVQGASCSAGTVLQTTTTDGSGNYSFAQVAAGADYLLCQEQPAGYTSGAANPGAAGSVVNANTIRLSSLPPAGSAGNHFGEWAGSVAGTVYLDANNDGVQQGAETGLAGVVMTLSGSDALGSPVTRTTTTDASGNYRFDDLVAAGPAGYTVTEQAAQPVAGAITTLNGITTAGTIAGTASGSATGVAGTPSAVSAIALAAGAQSVNNNFAEILPVSLSGTVFLDLNNDGLQNGAGDSGLPGVPLVLSGTDDLGNVVNLTLSTAADGSYSFVNLRPGTYTLTQPSQPAGTSNGLTLPGTAGGTATPPATVPSAITAIVLTTPGASSTGNNFAELANNSALSGRVWLDSNNNGAIDGSETGIAGVPMELTGTDSSGRTVNLSTTTDSSGNYNFEGLSPGNYSVRQPTQPAGTVNGSTVPGSAGGTATPVATTPSALSAITLGVGAVATANNFGEVPAGSISGRVYADNNNDGIVDAGEAGLGGVTLVLSGTDDLGNPVSITVVTGADGSYSFPGLRPGTYAVTQPTQPPGTVGGITSAGSLGGTATGPAVAISGITGIVLPPGGQALNNNFGELSTSPDLRASKRQVEPRFTVGYTGSYAISVRNAGDLATQGSYSLSDRLPAGLSLFATPTGPGWACVGAAGATSFTCSSSAVIAAGAAAAGEITALVNVAATAAANSPVQNVVLVEGGGEIAARAPSAAEREAFNGNPAALPVCTPAVEHNACRTPTAVQLAASISGTVWYDVGNSSRLLDGSDRRLAGWLVEVLDPATGNIVGRATTGSDGSYRVPGLLPGVDLAVRFRDPASGIVFGYPVNGESAPGGSGAACNPAAGGTGGASSCVGTGATPALTVVLAPGQDLPQQSLPVDPSGVVYDSGLRQPVAGSVVTLAPVGACPGWSPATSLVGATLGGYTINGGAVSMTVGADGFYQYLFAPAAPATCTFSLSVVPPAGYTFQSATIPPQPGTLTPSGGPGSTFAVQPQATAPTAAVGSGTAYFLTLTGGSAGANIIHNHIPLDPVLPTAITLAKTADKAAAEVGDSIRYSITVTVAAGPAPRQTTVLDRLPAGFTYIRGTAMVGDVPIADPSSNSPGGLGPLLAFNLGPMPASKQLVLRYRVRVGVGAQQGDGINRARGHACGVPAGCLDAQFNPQPGSVATNEGLFKVRVSGGVFTTDACVLGKVFVDCNGNHVQDGEELGVPGVRLVMQDGSTLISDSEGKYSICGLPPKSAILKVDPLTLPRGSRLTTSSNRNLGDAGSLWLDLKNGELHRADFVEGSCSNSVLEQVKARRAQGEVRAPEPERRGGPALRFDSKAHGLTPLSSPQQGTDGATQQAPKPRTPVAPAPGPVKDETNTPATQLPMNRPPPAGRSSGTAPSAGDGNASR